MSQKDIFEQLIQDLEKQRLALFMSVNNLDRVIGELQYHLNENGSKEFNRHFIKYTAGYRDSFAKIYDLDDQNVQEIFERALKELE